MVRLICLITAVTLGALTCVWSNLQVRQLQYEISDAEKEIRRERRSYKQVQIEFEKLRSPARLQELKNKKQWNFVSKSRARNQQLTPRQMQKIIRKRQLAGTGQVDVQSPLEEDR